MLACGCSNPTYPNSFFAMLAGMNRHFLEHPANARLATITVYTKGKSPTETRDEILTALHLDQQN